MVVQMNDKASSRRAENERKAVALVREAIKELRFGVISIVLQDGYVVQVERTEKYRLLSRRETHVRGEGEGI